MSESECVRSYHVDVEGQGGAVLLDAVLLHHLLQRAVQALHLQPATPLVLQLLLGLGSGNKNRFNGRAHLQVSLYLGFSRNMSDIKMFLTYKCIFVLPL